MNRSRKHIPTLLGIFILILGVAAGVFLLKSRQIFRLGAKEDTEPKYVTVSNIEDSSFNISFITSDAARSYIKVGTDKFFLGESQILRQPEKVYAHYFSVENLQPNKDYYFYVNTNGVDYFTDNLKTARTGSKIESIPESNILYGKVYSKSGEEQEGAIVYVRSGNGSLVSAQSVSDGGFAVPLSRARDKDLTSYIAIDPEKTPIETVVQYGDLTSSVTSFLKNSQPLPPVLLGNNQDIRNAQSPPNFFDLPSNGVYGTSTMFNDFPVLFKNLYKDR